MRVSRTKKALLFFGMAGTACGGIFTGRSLLLAQVTPTGNCYSVSTCLLTGNCVENDGTPVESLPMIASGYYLGTKQCGFLPPDNTPCGGVVEGKTCP